jgi:signal transduction histidine kinase
MKFNFLNKIANRKRIGFFAAFFLLFISYILTYVSMRKVASQDFWINHTNEVIHGLDNINGFINEAESNSRGYLLTNNNQILQDYDHSIRKTDSTFDKVRILTRDDIEQQKNLDTLHILIDEYFLWVENTISQFVHSNKTPPSYFDGNGKNLPGNSKIVTEINKMKQQASALWEKRSNSADDYAGLIQILNVVSIIIAVLLTFYSLIVYNKENRDKRTASTKADEYRKQLQNRVQELADLNTELIDLRSQEKYAVTGRIARVIAHEVRNPLTNINLATEQLHSEIQNNQNAELLFTMIARNSERINHLVKDLLSTTRVTELSFSLVSVNDLLDASILMASDRIELNHITVLKKYDTELSPISVDAEKIKIAFLNIIVNAIEAIDENGIIEINTSKKNNKCIVNIRDNGKGMTKVELSRIFEPYFTTKKKGNGFGLANTQNIILGHQASISAESESGKGTIFTITFLLPD